MKTRTIFCISILGVFLFSACSTKPTIDIKKTEWLIGTWVSKTEEGNSYESWSKTNDIEYKGKSYMINGIDTVVFETIRLVQEKGGLIYIPTVKDQNGGLPVRFVAKTISEEQLVFENPHHDFPQIISYTKIGSDSLYAEISGTENGQERKQRFPMRLLK